MKRGDVRMAPGDTTVVGGHSFKLIGVSERQGPNFVAMVGEVELSRDGKFIRTLRPEKAPVQHLRHADDRDRDRHRPVPRPVRLAGRTARWRRLVQQAYKPLVD